MAEIIGIAGKAGVGKTTLAEAVARRLGCSWWMAAFADALKQDAALEYGYPIDWGYSAEGKRRTVHTPRGRGRTVRELLQAHGAERRASEPGYWIRQVERRYLDPGPGGVVLDDVRYPDEATWIQGRGGVIVRLDPWPGWVPGIGADHESETALDDWTGYDVRVSISLEDVQPLARTIALLAEEGSSG